MDPKKHPLIEVKELLDTLRPARRGTYLLYAYHHELDCCLCQLAPLDAAKIAILSSRDINNGLASNIWQGVEDKIRILTKQGVLEWKTQKL